MSPTVCPNCGHNNQLDAHYCDECGVELLVVTTADEPSSEVDSQDTSAAFPPSDPSPISGSYQETESMADDEAVLSGISEVAASGSEESREEPHTVLPPPEPQYQPIPMSAPTVLDWDEPEPAVVESTTLEVPQATLVQAETGQRFELPYQDATVYIGKINEEMPVQIDLSQLPDADIISRVHAAIHREEETYYLEDAGSINGTTLNGEAVKPGARFRKQLKAGDTITLGRNRTISFTFEIE